MKTAIVGAGINGLYLAWKLSEQGHKITVFEKKERIGKEACSGLFSEKILRFIPESKKLIQNEIESVLIHFPRKTVKICFAEKFFVMDHFKLDNLVAELAQKAGAKIVLNAAVGSLPLGFDRIIGCDGADSTVRKKLNLAEPCYRLAMQGFLLLEDNSNYVETWPITEGFIWKIPRGKEVKEDKPSSSPFANARVTEYGIISSPSEAKNILDDFLAKNRISLGGTRAALVPQGFLIPKSSPKVTLCGDAAGLTKPWSGGGVIWGLLAADLLLKNFPDFLKYEKDLKKFFRLKILISKVATRMAYLLGINFPWVLPKNIRIKGDFLI